MVKWAPENPLISSIEILSMIIRIPKPPPNIWNPHQKHPTKKQATNTLYRHSFHFNAIRAQPDDINFISSSLKLAKMYVDINCIAQLLSIIMLSE